MSHKGGRYKKGHYVLMRVLAAEMEVIYNNTYTYTDNIPSNDGVVKNEGQVVT